MNELVVFRRESRDNQYVNYEIQTRIYLRGGDSRGVAPVAEAHLGGRLGVSPN